MPYLLLTIKLTLQSSYGLILFADLWLIHTMYTNYTTSCCCPSLKYIFVTFSRPIVYTL